MFTHVPAERQRKAMKFLQDELGTTPEGLIDQEIFNKIEFDGNLERVRSTQERTLNSLLYFGRIARIIKYGEINREETYR